MDPLMTPEELREMGSTTFYGPLPVDTTFRLYATAVHFLERAEEAERVAAIAEDDLREYVNGEDPRRLKAQNDALRGAALWVATRLRKKRGFEAYVGRLLDALGNLDG